MVSYQIIENYIKLNMSEFRYNHSQSVKETAIILSKKYNVDQEKIVIAAICHDMTKEDKNWNIEELKKIGIKDIEILSNSLLWHGYTAAYRMKKEFNIIDDEILSAVKFHTVGNEKMNNVSKIIYIADSIEPLRGDLEFYNYIISSDKTLDEVLMEVIIRKMEYLDKSDKKIHPNTKKMLNNIKKNLQI